MAFSFARSGVSKFPCLAPLLLIQKGLPIESAKRIKTPSQSLFVVQYKEEGYEPCHRAALSEEGPPWPCSSHHFRSAFPFLSPLLLLPLCSASAGWLLQARLRSRARATIKSPNALLREVFSLIAGREIHRHTRALSEGWSPPRSRPTLQVERLPRRRASGSVEGEQ